MVGVDTSSLVAYLKGEESVDVELVTNAIADESLIVPPFVVTELFSAKGISAEVKETVAPFHSFPCWRTFGSGPEMPD